jgi:hypothetical protein
LADKSTLSGTTIEHLLSGKWGKTGCGFEQSLTASASDRLSLRFVKAKARMMPGWQALSQHQRPSDYESF